VTLQVLSPNLPAALFRHAAERPEEPWLFRAEGWDWRWHSWGDVARRVERWAGPLAVLPAGTRVAFSYAPRPAALALDLAIQAAGLVSVPVSGGALPLRIEDLVWAEPAGDPAGERPDLGKVERVPLPAWEDESSSSFHRERQPGSALIELPEGWHDLDQEDLIAAADRVQSEVVAAGPPVGGREILVASRPLSEPAERAILSWATIAGAALVLEPDPASFAATAAWVRPTIFHGTADDVAALRRMADQQPRPRPFRRRPRLPFGRLRTILTGELPRETAAFWEERGVRVALLAEFLPAPTPVRP
jgi:hypothetical protein